MTIIYEPRGKAGEYAPLAAYRLIEATHEFVDFYKVGKLNYYPAQKNIDWPIFRELVIKQLNYYNKAYMIKKDLLAA